MSQETEHFAESFVEAFRFDVRRALGVDILYKELDGECKEALDDYNEEGISRFEEIFRRNLCNVMIEQNQPFYRYTFRVKLAEAIIHAMAQDEEVLERFLSTCGDREKTLDIFREEETDDDSNNQNSQTRLRRICGVAYQEACDYWRRSHGADGFYPGLIRFKKVYEKMRNFVVSFSESRSSLSSVERLLFELKWDELLSQALSINSFDDESQERTFLNAYKHEFMNSCLRSSVLQKAIKEGQLDFSIMLENLQEISGEAYREVRTNLDNLDSSLLDQFPEEELRNTLEQYLRERVQD